MIKQLKKITAFLLMSVVMIGAIPTVVSADEKGDERNVIYVQAPDEWENPCIWAWNEDGTNAFEAWPGEEMDKEPSNEGWYYLWVPSYANHVIINANSGTVQTEEVILEEGNAWVTINDDCSTSISYEALTDGEAPVYVDKFAVHVQVDDTWEEVSLLYGNEQILLSKGDDGLFSKKIPVTAESVAITNGTVTTEEISLDPAEVWITVSDDGNVDFSYVDPAKANVANITVSVMVPSDWDGASLWAWSAPDGTNVYTTWPGEAFEEGKNGWLQKEIPGWVNSVIINANEGSVQTTDISVEAEKDIWIVVNDAEDFELSYEEPVVEQEDSDVSTDEVKDEAVTTSSVANDDAQNSAKTNMTSVVIVVIAVIFVIAGGVVFVIKKKK